MELDEIKIGQVWREVDPRFERYVRVESVVIGRRGVAVQTVYKSDDGRWVHASGSRLSYCDPGRFNGKRGGYSLHEPKLST